MFNDLRGEVIVSFVDVTDTRVHSVIFVIFIKIKYFPF